MIRWWSYGLWVEGVQGGRFRAVHLRSLSPAAGHFLCNLLPSCVSPPCPQVSVHGFNQQKSQKLYLCPTGPDFFLSTNYFQGISPY